MKCHIVKSEAIYKCRCCERRFSIITEKESIVYTAPRETIMTDKCSNCCFSNDQKISYIIVADLVKFIMTDIS